MFNEKSYKKGMIIKDLEKLDYGILTEPVYYTYKNEIQGWYAIWFDEDENHNELWLDLDYFRLATEEEINSIKDKIDTYIVNNL